MQEKQTIGFPGLCGNAALSPHPWIYRFVFGLDRWLRRWHAVEEYSSHPRCIFRIQLSRLQHDVTLCDGTALRAGSRILNLHFWNEQLPPMPQQGPTIFWARQMRFSLIISLRELWRYLGERPDLEDICVIRAITSWGGGAQSAQMARLCQRYGFELVGRWKPRNIWEHAYLLGEDIFAWLVALVLRSEVSPGNGLHRDRVELFLSRKSLEKQSCAETASKDMSIR